MDDQLFQVIDNFAKELKSGINEMLGVLQGGQRGQEKGTAIYQREGSGGLCQHYKWRVKQLKAYSRTTSKKTGKPLSPTTLKHYASLRKDYQRSVKESKHEIRLAILAGRLGHKTRTRWLRESAQATDYTKGLSILQKKFVEAFAGNPVMAARQAGYRGNYVAVKKNGRENLKDPKIQKAIELRRFYKMAKAGMIALPGGGQGGGKPYMIKPERIPKTGLIYLETYLCVIKKRLLERVNVIQANDSGTGSELYNLVQDLKLHKDYNDDFDKAEEKIKAAEKKLNFVYRGGYYKGY